MSSENTPEADGESTILGEEAVEETAPQHSEEDEPKEEPQATTVGEEASTNNLMDPSEPDLQPEPQTEEQISESIDVESGFHLETAPSSFAQSEDGPHVYDDYPGEEEELSLSKGQQVMPYSDELMDPDEVMQDISDLILKTDLGPLGDADQPEQLPYVEPAKKNRRVQVPSTDITRGICRIEPSPKKPPKKKIHDPTPQKIGVLVGIPCRRRSSRGASVEDHQREVLKHFSLVFLFSRLKNPKQWNTETFEEIRSLGDKMETELVKSKFRVAYQGQTYCMSLTGTIVKARVNSADSAPPTFRDALIEHVSCHSGLVLKCESEYMITWKVNDGYYLYEPCLNDSSQLLFFNSLKMMTEFVVATKKLGSRSKYYLSKIRWSSVDDDHVVTLKRTSRRAKTFEVVDRSVAVLMGDRYLKAAGFKLESLRVSLNAISLAQNVEARSWDASSLNELFEGDLTEKVLNKLGIFVCEEGSEEHYLLEKFRMIRLDVAFGYTEREQLELLINRLLAIRVALIVKVDESYFAIWSSGQIMYWFSPFRYDALELDPSDLEDKACFLFAFNSLPRLSATMFDYLTERRLLPKHMIRLFSVDAEPFGKMPRVPVVDSKDSLNQSELEIHVEQEEHTTAFISDENLPGTTWSQAKLCRIMLREVIESSEKQYD